MSFKLAHSPQTVAKPIPFRCFTNTWKSLGKSLYNAKAKQY